MERWINGWIEQELESTSPQSWFTVWVIKLLNLWLIKGLIENPEWGTPPLFHVSLCTVHSHCFLSWRENHTQRAGLGKNKTLCFTLKDEWIVSSRYEDHWIWTRWWSALQRYTRAEIRDQNRLVSLFPKCFYDVHVSHLEQITILSSCSLHSAMIWVSPESPFLFSLNRTIRSLWVLSKATPTKSPVQHHTLRLSTKSCHIKNLVFM